MKKGIEPAFGTTAVTPTARRPSQPLLTEVKAYRQGTLPDDSRNEQWWSALDALDLDLYVPPPQSWFQRWLWGSPARRLVAQSRRSLLILQQPRWPLTQILFIVRAEPSDWIALSWIERLAQPTATTITILPIVPPWPRFYRATPYAQPTPDILLAPNTVSGAMITTITQRLRQQHLAVTLSLTTGEPDWRIQRAVDTCNPDLIVIAAETKTRWLRWLYGELVNPLLRWVTCPLLITKAT